MMPRANFNFITIYSMNNKVLKHKKLNLFTKCAMSTLILYNFQNKVMVIPSHKYCRVFVRYMHKQPNVYAIGTNLIRGTTPRVNPTVALRPNEVTIHSRTMTSVHVGNYKKPHNISKVCASHDKPTPINSDIHGGHKIAAVVSCSSAECKDYNCAVTSEEINPCKIPPEIHQGPMKEFVPQREDLVIEAAGALTHKIPSNKPGVPSCTEDFHHNKTNGPQLLVTETGVIPIDPSQFKENQETTRYIQDSSITEIVINNLSPESVLQVKDPRPTTLNYKVDVPLDDGF